MALLRICNKPAAICSARLSAKPMMKSAIREYFNVKHRLDEYDAAGRDGRLRTAEDRKRALAKVFQIQTFDEASLCRAHRTLARHVHPDKTTSILEASLGKLKASRVCETYQHLQVAFDEAQRVLSGDVVEVVEAPSNVDVFHVGASPACDVLLQVDATESDRATTQEGDHQSWVQVDLPDATGGFE